MKKCSGNCEAICGFCTYYDIDTKLCKKQNKIKEKYSDCNCGKFRCFTLDYYYKPEDYLTIDYIVKLYEGGIFKNAR